MTPRWLKIRWAPLRDKHVHCTKTVKSVLMGGGGGGELPNSTEE